MHSSTIHPAARVGQDAHGVRTPSRISPALSAAALLALFAAPLVLGFFGPVGDAALFHLPYQMLVGDFARAGEFLLWNPWTNGGSPDGAEPQIGAFSPIAVAAGFVGGGTTLSFTLLWLTTWCLSAAGFARLASHLGAPPLAAVALALAWSTNGAFIGHNGHTCFVHAFAFLPWMVLCIERAFERRGRGALVSAAGAGAWWGLSALAGYPGLVVVCGLILGAYTAVRMFASTGERRVALVRGTLLLCCTTAVMLLVVAPSYGAFFVEGAGYSGRTDTLPRDIASGWNASDPVQANALEPRALWTFASPFVAALAADPARGPANGPFAHTDPTSVGLDANFVVVCLAFAVLVRRGRSREHLALLGVALLFLGFALGGALPLRAWLYDLVPPTRLFRHAAFFRVGFLFALALLAAHGARELSAGRIEVRAFGRGAALLGGVFAAATALALFELELLRPATALAALAVVLPLGVGLVVWRTRFASDRATGTMSWCALALAAFALWSAGPLVYGSRERLERLDREHVAALDLGARGFDRRLLAPTIPDATAQSLLSGDLAAVADELADPVGRLFDSSNLPGKTAVLAGYTALNNALHHALARHPVLLRQAVGSQRVFFAREALHLPADAATFDAFSAASAGGDVPLVIHDGGTPPADLAAAVARARLAPLAFEVLRHTPRDLELALAEPSPEPGFLFVTERHAAGWRASVDGAPTPVLQAGFLWRAVALPAGAQRVHFHYRPFGWPWLLVVSWGTLALVAGAHVATRRE